jgi:hypothetical protein
MEENERYKDTQLMSGGDMAKSVMAPCSFCISSSAGWSYPLSDHRESACVACKNIGCPLNLNGNETFLWKSAMMRGYKCRKAIEWGHIRIFIKIFSSPVTNGVVGISLEIFEKISIFEKR